MIPTTRSLERALVLSLFLSALAFVDAVFNYFWTGNGIHGSGGALLVVISTALLALASCAVLYEAGPRPLRILLEALILLAFLGTAAAAYLLEAWILLALTLLAAVCWLAHYARRSPIPLPIQA